ncbi:DNA polymerase IV [Candidatus Uhrbacteria bacterium]|nr:DNA polymerase IV [Candidatus Uhrbacteria bacterium]
MIRAIIHIDGDAFFASCEQARNPALKDRPVITGKERGIASSMSYEAKRKGVTRGMRLFEIFRVCPDAIVLPSDYEMYSLVSQRFMQIVRRYTSVVEEYSIDECFADISGMDTLLGMPYEQIARRIQSDLYRELGCSFSVGLAPTKVLAKAASKWDKPGGCTVIIHETIHAFLSKISVGNIWGIGPQTASKLRRYGICTALDFITMPENWVRATFAKPFVQLWRELNGQAALAVECGAKKSQESIQKMKTFTPPSDKSDYVFSQLSRNIENACIRARRYGLAAREATFLLRTHDFRHFGIRARFTKATAFPDKIIHVMESMFSDIFHPRCLYRASGVVLSRLTADVSSQLDLFGDYLRIEKMSRLYSAVDAMDRKFGKHTVFAASSMAAQREPQHTGERAQDAWRLKHLLKGETQRRHVNIPLLASVR